MSFSDKVAIVTGGAQGIGLAYAELLAERGAHVVVADVNAAKAAVAAARIGANARAVTTDVASVESCNACAAAAIAAFGGVDYLVNNAGLLSAATLPPLHLMDLVDYQRVLAVNTHSVLLMTRAVIESMKARGGGAIVNTSSIGGWQASGVYGLSKLGVNGLTIALARELGPSGIRVNAVAPGTVATEGMQPIMSVEQMSQWGAMLGRPTTEVAGPRLIAQVGVFLLSEDAHYISGQIVAADGGIMVRP